MKAKLLFDLNDMDDRTRHEQMLKAGSLVTAINKYLFELRSIYKYPSDNEDENRIKYAEEFRAKFFEILDDHQILDILEG